MISSGTFYLSIANINCIKREFIEGRKPKFEVQYKANNNKIISEEKNNNEDDSKIVKLKKQINEINNDVKNSVKNMIVSVKEMNYLDNKSTEFKDMSYKLILKTSLIKAKEIFDYNSKTIKIINTFINKKTCINIYGNDINILKNIKNFMIIQLQKMN